MSYLNDFYDEGSKMCLLNLYKKCATNGQDIRRKLKLLQGPQ